MTLGRVGAARQRHAELTPHPAQLLHTATRHGWRCRRRGAMDVRNELSDPTRGRAHGGGHWGGEGRRRGRCATSVFPGTSLPISQTDSVWPEQSMRVLRRVRGLTVCPGVSVCLSLCRCVSGEGGCTGGTPAARSYFSQLMPQHYL